MQRTIIKQDQTIVLYDLEKSNITKHFVLHKNAQLTYIFLITGSAEVTLSVELLGSKALARIFGLCVLSEQQEVTIKTQQKHRSPSAESTVLIKGIVVDQARSLYQGSIVIDKDAHKSVAAQQSKMLLLSPHAHAWAQPSLEVLTNDVQCAHGSASGQLDVDQLLYLQSRGLTERAAKHLLLQGFFADILNKVNNRSLFDTVMKKIKL